MVKYEAHGRQDTLCQVRDVQAWVPCPVFAFSTWGMQGLAQNVNIIRLETLQLLGCVIAVIADYSLCRIKKETNSVKESLALQPFNDIRGDCPDHCIHVAGFSGCCPSWSPGPGASGLGCGPWSGWPSWTGPPWGAPSLAASGMGTSGPWSWGPGRSASAARHCGGLFLAIEMTGLRA